MGEVSEIDGMFLQQDEEPAEEEMTAQQVLGEIQEAWLNEKLSPELLPHKSEFVEVMMEQIEQMEENVARLQPTDLRAVVHKIELERIRYLMRSYLRTRLLKIEQYALWLLKPEEDRTGSRSLPTLSSQESVFLKDFVTASLEHFKTMTDSMPRPTGALNLLQMEVKPELETHVFIKSKISTSGIIVRDESSDQREEEVELREGSQHIIPYASVRDLVRKNKD